MGDFIKRLGKKVQGLLDKIFGKKDKKPQSWHDTSGWTNITSTDMKLGAGEVFLDGVSLGKVESITLFQASATTPVVSQIVPSTSKITPSNCKTNSYNGINFGFESELFSPLEQLPFPQV